MAHNPLANCKSSIDIGSLSVFSAFVKQKAGQITTPINNNSHNNSNNNQRA